MVSLLDIKSCYYNIRHKTKTYIVIKSFRRVRKSSDLKKYSKIYLSPLEDFEYKDETWDTIRNLNEFLIAAATHKSIHTEDNRCFLSSKGCIENNSIVIKTPTIQNNWLCFFYNKPLPREYIFGFDITIFSEFTEVQIAFKYESLANRLRFMIRNNREAVFEIIRNGYFYKRVFSKPVSLRIGEANRLTLRVDKNKFSFSINGEEILSVKEVLKMSLLGDGLALILYNASDNTLIECEAENLFLGTV